MHRTRIWGLAVLLAAGCADLSTVPENAPASIQLTDEIYTTTKGLPVDLRVTVLDEAGNVIENVPEWARITWKTSNGSIVSVADNALNAVGAGQTTVTAAVAGFEESAIVRVNPESLKLEIATILLTQGDNPSGFLQPGVETDIQVFLVADQVNFFEPTVEATLFNEAGAVATLTLQRSGSSIPLQLNTHDPAGAWTAVIPANLVEPGLSIVVEADRERTIVRAGGSRDRYPETGAFFVAVGEASVQVQVAGAYLTQSVQRFDNSIPLVQGRDAVLRVFLRADEENLHRPVVRASFYRNGAVVHQADIASDALSIPLNVQEGLLGRSWNVRVPGNVLQPGTSLVIEVDPNRTIPVKAGSQMRLPVSGTWTLDVRTVPPLWLRLIPIQQVTLGTTGNVTSGNMPEFVSAITQMFPLVEVNADLRLPYLTNNTAATNSGWLTILNEIRTLRITDGSGRYYYGVLRHPGGNQTGGLGYIGAPAAIGFDAATRATETFAHELGHNFSLRHAPCGGPSDADPLFPHGGGNIGHYGYNLQTNTLMLPSEQKDLMSYCAPEWISDFHYEKALNYRQNYDWNLTGPNAVGEKERALLVWGRTLDDQMVLEPAFQLDMVPVLPSDRGSHAIEGRDAAGAVLFSYRFEPETVDHLGAGSFAFAIPERLASVDRLEELVLTGPQGQVRRQRGQTAPSPARPTVFQGAPLAEVAWNSAEAPVALIRDNQTGQVISFARGGRVSLPGRVVDVILSDGVRSTRQTFDLR